MNVNRMLLPFVFITTIFGLLANSSCKHKNNKAAEASPAPAGVAVVPTNTNTPPPPPDTTGVSGVVNNNFGFFVKAIDEAGKYEYKMHNAVTSDLGADDCEIKKDSTVKDIQCIVEARELDLWFFGARLQYHVPSNLCSYLRVEPFYFYQSRPGYGPIKVKYDINAAGNIESVAITNNYSESPASAADARAYLDSKTKTPVCIFDYSRYENGDPNCCVGAYTKEVRTWNASASPAPAFSPAVITDEKWAGKISNCLAGPAMDTQTKTKEGWPRPTLHYVENAGLNLSYLIKKLDDNEKFSGFTGFIANYFNPTEHAGDIPIGMKSFLDRGITISGTSPYYEFTCTDRAYEIIARIRVMIREWNQVIEYDKVAGDPNITGSELAFDNPAINDIRDWKDLRNIFPIFDPYWQTTIVP